MHEGLLRGWVGWIGAPSGWRANSPTPGKVEISKAKPTAVRRIFITRIRHTASAGPQEVALRHRGEQHARFGGRQEVWCHLSATLGCDNKFGIYLPETALRGEPRPALHWLPGLTCTEQSFITKPARNSVNGPSCSPRCR